MGMLSWSTATETLVARPSALMASMRRTVSRGVTSGLAAYGYSMDWEK